MGQVQHLLVANGDEGLTNYCGWILSRNNHDQTKRERFQLTPGKAKKLILEIHGCLVLPISDELKRAIASACDLRLILLSGESLYQVLAAKSASEVSYRLRLTACKLSRVTYFKNVSHVEIDSCDFSARVAVGLIASVTIHLPCKADMLRNVDYRSAYLFVEGHGAGISNSILRALLRPIRSGAFFRETRTTTRMVIGLLGRGFRVLHFDRCSFKSDGFLASTLEVSIFIKELHIDISELPPELSEAMLESAPNLESLFLPNMSSYMGSFQIISKLKYLLLLDITSCEDLAPTDYVSCLHIETVLLDRRQEVNHSKWINVFNESAIQYV